MEKIFVVGVGMTRFGKLLDRSVKDLTREAVAMALEDAGCDLHVIGAAFFANAAQSAVEGQYMIPGQLALRAMGFSRIPIVNVENACASASTALYLACQHLRAGAADAVLAVGAEKMFTPDKEKNLAVLNGAWDVHDVAGVVRNLARIGEGIEAPETEAEGARSVFMDVYASLAKQHMKRYGTTPRQLAAVAAKNHHHSVHNPLSQYRSDFSIDEVLAARSIAWPLTLPMCSPISDGAAAAILCREDALDRFKGARPIRVFASVLASGSDREPDDLDEHISLVAARQAYDLAGVGPKEISVAEVHDASAMGEIIQTENLGFCAMGDGGALAERGETSLGGRIPINPSGGLESKGHPIGATGLGQIYELVGQLRNAARARQVEGARFAIAENGGGFHGYEEAAACITILGRP
ncbi:MAG TPA: thiolase family protein [Caldimonas sp.]